MQTNPAASHSWVQLARKKTYYMYIYIYDIYIYIHMYCNIYIYICGYGDCMNQNWVPYMAWSATNGPTSALSSSDLFCWEIVPSGYD